MYDCQSDSYADFTVAQQTAPVTAQALRRPAPLAGDVHVRALPGHEAVLTELAVSAERQGYLAERRGARLTLFAVTLADVLAFNRAFAARATFSAEFRLAAPVAFHG